MKVIVKNLATEYVDEGNPKGLALLFLHGWKNDLHTFDLLVAELGSEYRMVRLDLPGFGKTEIPEGNWHLDDYVNFVDSFMKKLGIRADVLVGHSLGGRIIIKGLASGTFLPQKVVLIGSAGVTERKPLRNAMITFIAKIGKTLMAIPPFSSLRENLRKKLYKVVGSDYGDAGTMKGTFLNIVGEDLSSCAAQISLPTLLIWGDHDMQTPLVDGERLHRMIVGSVFDVVSDAGHFVHCEKPKVVAQIMKKFIYHPY